MALNIASLEDIRSGKVTDVYFDRAVTVLKGLGEDRQVTMEVTASAFPDEYEYAVLAGLDEVVPVAEGLEIDIDAMPEGTVLERGEPVMRLSGWYTRFGAMETAILGLLCQASGVATKASRCKWAAGDRSVISFGARRMHPAIAPMIERAAYVGGCDGVAVVRSAELLGIPPVGTMPHSLIMILGDLPTALNAFHRYVPQEVPRIALIDTFTDEKIGAIAAAEALGKALDGVRLDTPGSRRGNFEAILAEVRWELDLRGYEQVHLFVSGDMDEQSIAQLNPLANGYGVGTAISNARVINFALDIVEIEGQAVTKRGKKSGVKEPWVCDGCGERRVGLASREPAPCACGGTWQASLQPLLRAGRTVADLPDPQQVRDRALQQVRAWHERRPGAH